MFGNNLPLLGKMPPDDGHDIDHHIIWRSQHLQGTVLVLIEANQKHLDFMSDSK